MFTLIKLCSVKIILRSWVVCVFRSSIFYIHIFYYYWGSAYSWPRSVILARVHCLTSKFLEVRTRPQHRGSLRRRVALCHFLYWDHLSRTWLCLSWLFCLGVRISRIFGHVHQDTVDVPVRSPKVVDGDNIWLQGTLRAHRRWGAYIILLHINTRYNGYNIRLTLAKSSKSFIIFSLPLGLRLLRLSSFHKLLFLLKSAIGIEVPGRRHHLNLRRRNTTTLFITLLGDSSLTGLNGCILTLNHLIKLAVDIHLPVLVYQEII